MSPELTILWFAAGSCVITLYFLWRTAGYVAASRATASSLKEKLEFLEALKRRIDILEADISDKFDHFVKKSASREAMRKRREAEKAEEDESEDSNTSKVLLPV